MAQVEFVDYPANYVPKDSVVVTLWLDTDHMIFFSDRQAGRIGYSFACSCVNGKGKVWPLQTIFRAPGNVLVQVTHVFVVPKVPYLCREAPDNISYVFVGGRVLPGIVMNTTQLTVTVSRDERMTAIPVQFNSTSSGLLSADIGIQLDIALGMKTQWVEVSSLIRVPRFSRAKYFYWDTLSSLMSALPTTDQDVPMLCWQQAGSVYPVNREYQIGSNLMSLTKVEVLATPQDVPEVFQVAFSDVSATESTRNTWSVGAGYDNIQFSMEQHVDEVLLSSSGSKRYSLCNGASENCSVRETMQMGGEYTSG